MDSDATKEVSDLPDDAQADADHRIHRHPSIRCDIEDAAGAGPSGRSKGHAHGWDTGRAAIGRCNRAAKEDVRSRISRGAGGPVRYRIRAGRKRDRSAQETDRGAGSRVIRGIDSRYRVKAEAAAAVSKAERDSRDREPLSVGGVQFLVAKDSSPASPDRNNKKMMKEGKGQNGSCQQGPIDPSSFSCHS